MDPGFHCELCSSILSMVQILRKHYKQVHGLSNEEAQAKTAGLKEPKKTCEHCGGEVIRLSRHVCPRVVSVSPPQGQRAAKKARNQTNIAGPSRPSGLCPSPGQSSQKEDQIGGTIARSIPGNLEKEALIPQIMKRFETYIVKPTGGGNSKRTAETYTGRMKSFLIFHAQKDGKDAPIRITKVSSKGDYLPLPPIGDWVDTFYPNEEEQISSRLQCFNAYIQFCDFLYDELKKNIVEFAHNQSEYGWRKEHIFIQKDEVRNFNTHLSAKLAVVKKKQKNFDDEYEGQLPLDVMKKVLNDYTACEARANIFSSLSEQIYNFKKIQMLLSEERLRDWLMLEYFVQAAGKRPDTVLNLKWGELSRAKTDGEFYVVKVDDGKTANTYGSMTILLPKALHTLMINFCVKIYPYFNRLQLQKAKSEEEKQKFSVIQLDDHVFKPSSTGETMDRIDGAIKTLQRFVPKSVGSWNIKPNDYRKFCASVYQNSDDPLTRENAPRDQGHSQATAKKYYELESQVHARRKEMRKEVLGKTLTDPILCTEPGTSVSNYSDEAAELIKKQKEEMMEKKKKQQEQLKEDNFQRTGRKKLMPSETKRLRDTFDHLGRDTLLAKDIDEALKMDKFASFFNDIKLRENQFKLQNDSDIKVLLQSAYRASKRGEKNN